MRLRETSLQQRMLCLAVVILVLAPIATAARLPVPRMESSAPPVLRAADLDAGLAASSARASGDLAWHHEDGRFVTEALKAATGRLAIVVEGVDVVAFRYTAPRDAAVGVLVDGVAQKWLPAGTDAPFDLALDGRRHTVAWSVVAERGDAVAVRVEGTQPLLDPALLGLPRSLLVCMDELLPIRLGWARAVPADALEVRVDGEPVPIRSAEAKRGWNVVETTLHVALPPLEAERSLVHVTVDARLGDRVLRLVDGLVEVVASLTVAWDLPSDWEYDLTPTIGVESLCPANPVVDVRLEVDGEDVTHRMDPHLLGAHYTFDRELAFREEHAYVLEAKLRHGPAFRYERTFMEGLDVLELDVNPGFLHFAKAPGAWVMLAPENPADLAPLVTGNGASFAFGQIVPLPTGAHLRAVHAPLAIQCTSTGLCDPFTGDAPGFVPRGVPEATLTVTSPTGSKTTYPALGQLVAASHQSSVGPMLLV